MQTCKIDVRDHDPLEAIRGLVRTMLTRQAVQAVLAPLQRTPSQMVMPTLVCEPQLLDAMDPLAPAFPLNAATMAARLTRKPSGGKIAVLLRPCEIRAFFELVKLNQATREDVFVVGCDCLGAYSNRDYQTFVHAHPDGATRLYYQQVLASQDAVIDGIDVTAACRACISPQPEGADVTIGLRGVPVDDYLLVQCHTPAGEALLKSLELAQASVPDRRVQELAALLAQREKAREVLFNSVTTATDTLEKLQTYLQNCINCYNCRVACPVCYCRECVFVTDVFDHEPVQYLGWAHRKGALKMPTDTLFYHLTRMAHISTACVGCGKCSNACPNDIEVSALMSLVARRAQQAFGYSAGRAVDQKPPLAEFREKEFEDIVGI
jgi:formate dehydrogenase subunit beta